MARRFNQVDVFTTTPYAGNPVAVVLDSEGLSTEQMQSFAHWTNLSETTFVLPPSEPEADYRVRIFTVASETAARSSTVSELPFAGHPTLGTCHAWLSSGGTPKEPEVIVQQCAAGLIPVRRMTDGLAFAAPPLIRSGSVEESVVSHIASVLSIDRDEIQDAQWVDNGPGWVAVLLSSAEAVLALRPGFVDLDLGVVGPSARLAAGVRGARLLPQGRLHRRGPCHRELERFARSMATGNRSSRSPLRRKARHGARARGPSAHLSRCRWHDLGRGRDDHLHRRAGSPVAQRCRCARLRPFGLPDRDDACFLDHLTSSPPRSAPIIGHDPLLRYGVRAFGRRRADQSAGGLPNIEMIA